MVIAHCLLLFLVVASFRIAKPSVDDSFPNRRHCLPIKGVCIALVFLGHAGGYLYSSGTGGLSVFERFLFFFHDNFGQLVVVPFLFFSGYGVARSLELKGDGYLASIPMRRLFRTLSRFDIAVLCFIALNLILGIQMSIRQVVLSFVGWDSVGNSNWYIFIILICYSATWISALIGRAFSFSSNGKNCLLSLVIIIVMVALTYHRDSFWYNTMLSYPAGAFYAGCRDRINRLFRGHFCLSLVVLGMLTVGVHVVTHYIRIPGGDIWYNFKSVAFALFVVCLMTRIELRSVPLSWMGENLFEIYIYQRLPMIVLVVLFPSMAIECRDGFVLASAIATVGVVFLIGFIKNVKWVVRT